MVPGNALRVGHIDDHESVRYGLRAVLDEVPGIDVLAAAATVAGLLRQVGALDVVVLDLRLGDGSTVTSNIEQLRSTGARVLCFTGADDPALVREAAIAGASGVIRKTEATPVLVDAIRRCAADEVIPSVDWAAALDGDPRLADARLSPQEQLVLALYASGEKTVTVANRLGVADKTVSEYVRRIRAKYAIAGRPAHSRVDLYKRALEDGYLQPPGGEGA